MWIGAAPVETTAGWHKETEHMGRMEGKVALVTGGASGLGRADAILLAREGAKVVVTDIDEDAGSAVAREIDGLFVRHDVRSESDWRDAIGGARERCGRLDVVVNNAGNVVVADVESTSLEQYRLLLAIHAEGTFLGCKYGNGRAVRSSTWARSPRCAATRRCSPTRPRRGQSAQ